MATTLHRSELQPTMGVDQNRKEIWKIKPEKSIPKLLLWYNHGNIAQQKSCKMQPGTKLDFQQISDYPQ